MDALETPTVKLWNDAMEQRDVPEVEKARESYRRHLRCVLVLELLEAVREDGREEVAA